VEFTEHRICCTIDPVAAGDRQRTDGRTSRPLISYRPSTALCIASYADALQKPIVISRGNFCWQHIYKYISFVLPENVARRSNVLYAQKGWVAYAEYSYTSCFALLYIR